MCIGVDWEGLLFCLSTYWYSCEKGLQCQSAASASDLPWFHLAACAMHRRCLRATHRIRISCQHCHVTVCWMAAGGARGTAAGVVGWVLRHRRMLVIAYAVALHCLVYYLLLSRGSCSQVRALC